MPEAPRRPCRHSGCGVLVDASAGYCPKHAREERSQIQKRYDEKRGSNRERGYDTRWRKARWFFLVANPLCVECGREGVITPATVVDHIIPHRGDQAKFWDTSNWQPLCKRHHDIKTVREDGGGWRRSRGTQANP